MDVATVWIDCRPENPVYHRRKFTFVRARVTHLAALPPPSWYPFERRSNQRPVDLTRCLGDVVLYFFDTWPRSVLRFFSGRYGAVGGGPMVKKHINWFCFRVSWVVHLLICLCSLIECRYDCDLRSFIQLCVKVIVVFTFRLPLEVADLAYLSVDIFGFVTHTFPRK